MWHKNINWRLALAGFALCIVLSYLEYILLFLETSSTVEYDNLAFSTSNPRKTVIDELNLAEESKKVILKWHRGVDIWRVKQKTLPWECGSCEIINDKAKINEANVSAVIFRSAHVKPELMPDQSKRRQDQLYVWVTGESSSNLLLHKKFNFTYIDEIGFNATATYRKDSDFPIPYGISWEKLRMKKPPNKTKLAVAVVSDCAATVGARARLKYLKKFRKHFPLDGYGRCFGNTLSKEEALKATMQYKFYFAFENSYHCRDYITEKLTVHALLSESVPVVWGATKQDYESRIPPGSFIFVEDYQPMEKLTKYLHYLDKNETAYLQYFKWREDLDVLPGRKQTKSGICGLCLKINGINLSEDFQEMNISEISRFATKNVSLYQWLLDDNKECLMENITIK